MRRRELVLRRAPVARVPAQQLRLRTSDRSEQVRLPEGVRCRRPRHRRQVLPRMMEECAGSRTLHQMVQATVAQPISKGSPRGWAEIGRRTARTYPAGTRRCRCLHRFRQRCRRLAVSRWLVLGSRRNRLSGGSLRRRSTRAMQSLHLHRFCLLQSQQEPPQTVILLPVTLWDQAVRLTPRVQAVLAWYQKSPPLEKPVPQIPNRPRQRRERARLLALPIRSRACGAGSDHCPLTRRHMPRHHECQSSTRSNWRSS